MFDLHSHVLPRIDDGARSLDMSLAMLSMAKEQGISVLAATPHCVTDKEEGITSFVEKRKSAYEAVCEEMKVSPKDYPKIILGAEVYLGCDISELSNLHELCYENTDYMLLEMPSGYEPSELAEWVYNIKIKGIHPVIAHIDRYTAYKEIMDEFTSLNVVYQLNASQFYTISGRNLLRHIFKRHDKFFVSSDMHNMTSRACNMGKAMSISEKKFPKLCDMLFEKGAECIVENRKFKM